MWRNELVAHVEKTSAIELRYDDAIIAEIKSTLPVFSSAEAEAAFPQTIRDWAVGYFLVREALAPDARRAAAASLERRAEVQKRATSLLETLDSFDGAAQYFLAAEIAGREPLWGSLPSDADFKRLTEIISAVRHLAFLPPSSEVAKKKGRKKHTARYFAVKALCQIYIETTGKRPTLNRNAYADTNTRYGPFLEFCRSCMRPIEGPDQEGLDALIGRCLYTQK